MGLGTRGQKKALIGILAKIKPDLAIITESHLQEDPKIPQDFGYNMFRTPNDAHKGVLILLKKDIEA